MMGLLVVHRRIGNTHARQALFLEPLRGGPYNAFMVFPFLCL
jgi:hypothetical protein